MIASVEEFARLRQSEDPEEYQRSANEEAPLKVWLAVLERFPSLREWVANNKTVPLSVLERLAQDSDPRVRATVAAKRKITVELQWLLAGDIDSSVRGRLACNAKCDVGVLELLSADPESIVRVAAIKRLEERRSAL